MTRSIALVAALFASTATQAQVPSPARWVESWGTAQPLLPPPPPPAFAKPRSPQKGATATPAAPSPIVPVPPTLADQTVRMVVRTSVGGGAFRLAFRAVAGGGDVTFGSVHAAYARPGGSIDPASDRGITFGGKPRVVIAAGATIWSDPIALTVPALADIAVSIHLPTTTPTDTRHALGLNPTYITKGDTTAAARLFSPEVVRSYLWLAGLAVGPAPANTGTIVAFGDSITDGYASTPGTHRAWPDLLAERLQREGPATLGVVNAGISGNRILKTGFGDSALTRFDTDALARPGVRWVLLLEGINDINMTIIPGVPAAQGTDAASIIAGISELIERAHLHGVRVAGATILPTKGLPFWSMRGEAIRAAVNHWIRTGGRFDAVIDFDAAVRDPTDPLRLRPDFDPGDHVHPNDAGNRAMAAAIDLAIFR